MSYSPHHRGRAAFLTGVQSHRLFDMNLRGHQPNHWALGGGFLYPAGLPGPSCVPGLGHVVGKQDDGAIGLAWEELTADAGGGGPLTQPATRTFKAGMKRLPQEHPPSSKDIGQGSCHPSVIDPLKFRRTHCPSKSHSFSL